jgi:hypothetical protein
MEAEATGPVWTLNEDELSWTTTDDGQVVILDLATSRYLSLNASAAALWELLATGADRSALIGLLGERFSVAPDQAARDVDAFLAALQERRYVEADR